MQPFKIYHRLPPETWADVAKVVERNRRRIALDPQDVDYMFALYARYFPRGEEQRKDCIACIAFVWGKFQLMARQITEDGANE